MDPVSPMDPWARRRARPRQTVRASRLIAGFLLALMFLIGTIGVDLYTDALWFQSLGLLSVFSTALAMQVALFIVGFLVFLAAY